MIKKLFLIVGIFVTLLATASGLTDLQKQFVRQRVQITQRDTQTLPGKVINHFRQGNRSWCTTNDLAVISRAIALKLSKLNLITSLKSRDKWTSAKAFIQQAGYYDEWLACQFIMTDHPAFISATNQAVRAGIATDKQIKTVIEESVDH